LRQLFRSERLRVIAEVKRSSPSAGTFDAGLDAAGQAQRYAAGGAAAVSVLTDAPYFQGSLEDLQAMLNKARTASQERTDYEVRMFRGVPSRCTQYMGGEPYLDDVKWNRDTIHKDKEPTGDSETRGWLDQAARGYENTQQPVLPAFFPIAATAQTEDGPTPLLIYRSYWGVHAVNLRSGELDWWETATADLSPMLAQDRNIVLDHPDGNGIYAALRFNELHPPFDDPAIPCAPIYALDRHQIVDLGCQGSTQATTLPFPIYTPMLPYFDGVKDLLDKYPIGTFASNKTAQIMQKKGYTKDSEGLWTKDGKRFATEGLGWDRPADPKDPDNQVKNRRVEVKVYSAEKQ